MKRILCMLFAAMLVLLCGCSAFLEEEYFSVTDYEAGGNMPDEPEIGAISSYSGLMAALENMVEQHQQSAQLQFNNYAGNISDDLAEAGWQLKSNTALGAYMIDYISYDISRIVTYYQATVYINYTRSVQDMEEIRSVGANRIDDTIVGAVAEGSTKLVMRIYNSAMGVQEMLQRIDNALLEAPGRVSVMPETNVTVYSGRDAQDIFELRFDYSRLPGEIKEMSTQLDEALKTAAEQISRDDEYSIAVLAAVKLGDMCNYDAEMINSTAYDALVLGSGDSRALSMAYAAVCTEKGVQCRVVSGLKNNEEYWWCVVKIGDYWYHVDVAEAMEMSPDTVFLFNDTELMRSYRWDELEYPACEGPSFISASESREAPPEEVETEKIEEN